MHQYLDSDGSGTSPTCVSSTIGAERLQAATQWLQQNNLKGFLGEIGTGSNGEHSVIYRVARVELICFVLAACITAVQGALCEMQQSGVWLGALWWAAGPWWGTVSGQRRYPGTRVFTHSSAVLPIDRAPKRSRCTLNPSAGTGALPVRAAASKFGKACASLHPFSSCIPACHWKLKACVIPVVSLCARA